ncbi:hypothetical protein BG006_007170 [Podila minutissima]|uniref:GOST seven transmembrane domain-containing protein n=1 Tax=Podila minutissima TaxID=64525 RepID=A0A9P5SHN9_9FUNG|nr:hypothetical protein BG006_007170 [Podila minutissima]
MRLKAVSSLMLACMAMLASVAQARPELVISEDQRALINIGSFGFLPGGTLGLDLQNLKKAPSNADAVDWETDCILDNPFFKIDMEEGRSEFQSVDPEKTTFNYNYVIKDGEQEQWTIIFVNCPRSIVSFKLKTTEMNPGQNHLSAGDIPLPKVYGASAVAYAVAAMAWLYMLTRNDTKVFWPHKLIFILAVMISVQKAFQALKTYYMGQGVDAEGWTVMFYIFAFLKGSLSILIITLIASGWMFIKPFLSQKDKKIILIIIPLQILSNIAQTIQNETAIGSINWAFWSQVFPLVDLISCVVILGVIIQTQRHLSEAAEAEGKVNESKSKYKLWGSFYLITVVYMYLTRILIEFLKAALPYQYVQWLVELLNEAITLGFYATVGYKFRPYANNPYTLIDEDEHDHDIEEGSTGDHVGLQTMSRREARTDRDD